MRNNLLAYTCSFLFCICFSSAQGPLKPQDELATFKINPAFTITLAAAEPNVVDPVAACFCARGHLYVCEMRGYPNGGVGVGNETRGRIRRLTDRNGDGVYETATIFAEGLRFPMGILPFKNGVIVAIAPDLVYFPDENQDGVADSKEVLYTGFDLANIQQMANSLTWGSDNRIHGVAGNVGGVITSPQDPKFKALNLKGKGFHFNPNLPGSMQTESGGGQYGLTYDASGHAFTATNNQHLRQIVFREQDLARNPNLPPTASTIDIPDHGAACRMYRISPFESWRVERTTRRAGGTDAKRFASQELVPGGYATSTCSPLVYMGGEFPRGYEGNCFVCDPANNLIHRDNLVPNGAGFTGMRVDDNCEFLASTDVHFRPVGTLHAPDGSMLVLDFYREAIETPLSLPPDIKDKMNLESAGRGRIWRVRGKGFEARPAMALQDLDSKILATLLNNKNIWTRATARRLLIERGAKDWDTDAVLAKAWGTETLPNVLSALQGLSLLKDSHIAKALTDTHWGNRCYAISLVEGTLAHKAQLITMAEDPSAMVRFRVALSLAAYPEADVTAAVLKIANKDAGDALAQTAVLIAARRAAPEVLAALWKTTPTAAAKMLPRVIATLPSPIPSEQLAALLKPVLAVEAGPSVALADALDGLAGAKRKQDTAISKRLPPEVFARFTQAETVAGDSTAKQRIAAIRLLAHAETDTATHTLFTLLTPQESVEIQQWAIRSLAAKPGTMVTSKVLALWPKLGPTLKREAQEMLMGRADRFDVFLKALESETLKLAEVDTTRLALLKTNPRVAVLLAKVSNTSRKAVLELYTQETPETGNTNDGKKLFMQHCAACHKLDGQGHEVGPNLLTVVPGKSREEMLLAVLDPNKEVDPRYVEYVATLTDGRVVTGIVTAETSAGVTLRKADGVEVNVKRTDIEQFRSSGQSLMPEGMEKNITPKQFADLREYLKDATKAK